MKNYYCCIIIMNAALNTSCFETTEMPSSVQEKARRQMQTKQRKDRAHIDKRLLEQYAKRAITVEYTDIFTSDIFLQTVIFIDHKTSFDT